MHGELLTKASSFNQYYSVGYVHQLTFDPHVEDVMVIKFGLGSSSGYDYSPSTMHGCYGYETMAGELQSCADCSKCTVCGFSISGVVSCGIGHCGCKIGLYILQIEQMLQELVGDDWDITQVFTWYPGGGEW